jgi:hypothetical protein
MIWKVWYIYIHALQYKMPATYFSGPNGWTGVKLFNKYGDVSYYLNDEWDL